MNETLVRSDGRNVLRIERRVAHPPAKVWRAVTEPAELSAWFPSAVELDELRVGAEIRFVTEGFGNAGTITAVDPPRLFAFDWEGELLRFELAPDGDAGCLLVFTHTFDDRAGAASFAAGWDACLGALGVLLGGGTPPAGPLDMTARHEQLVARFGLDAGTLETTDDGGWQVRFERQLTRHAAAVWELLTDGQEPPRVGSAPPPGFVRDDLAPGPITAVEPERLVEYQWSAAGRPAGRVRWELGQGTGQGARLIVTQTGAAGLADEPARALAAWRPRVEQLAAHAAGSR